MIKRVIISFVLFSLILLVFSTLVSALSLKVLDEIEVAEEGKPIHIEVTTSSEESGHAIVEVKDSKGDTIAKKEIKLYENTRREVDLAIGEDEKSQAVINDEKVDQKKEEIKELEENIEKETEDKEKERKNKEIEKRKKEIEGIEENTQEIKEKMTEPRSLEDIIKKNLEHEHDETPEEEEVEFKLEKQTPDLGIGKVTVTLYPEKEIGSQVSSTKKQNATKTRPTTEELNVSEQTNATKEIVVEKPIIMITSVTKSSSGGGGGRHETVKSEDENKTTNEHETNKGEIIITKHRVEKINKEFLNEEFKRRFNGLEPDLIYVADEDIFVADGIKEYIDLRFLGKYEFHYVLVEIEALGGESGFEDETLEHELAEMQEEFYEEKSGIFNYAFFRWLFGF